MVPELGLSLLFVLASVLLGWQCWRLQREQDRFARALLAASLRSVDATRVQDGMGRFMRNLHGRTTQSLYGSIRALNHILGLSVRQDRRAKEEDPPRSKSHEPNED